MVVRYQGGDNAGHTVVKGDEVLKLHLVPSGVLYPHITSVIGNGVVVNPETLIGELDMLISRGIDVSRVRVSRAAHVIMPYHVALDRANEARLDGAKVGTTGRGIGPAYGDRAWRVGLRMEDLLDRAVLRDRLARLLPDKNLLLRSMGAEPFEIECARREGGRVGRAARGPPRRHDLARAVRAGARRARPARGRAGHAARPRPRLVPVRDLLQRGRGRRDDRRRHRAAPGRRGHGRDEGVRHARRLRAVSDRADRRGRRGDPRTRARGGDHHGPAATRRLVRRRADPLRGRGQLGQQHHAQQARHPVRARIDPAVRRVRGRRRAGRALALVRGGAGAREARLRVVRGLVRADPRHPLAGRACPRTRAATSRPSRSSPACRSCSSRSGRSERRPSSGHGGRCAGEWPRGSYDDRADAHAHRRLRGARARPRLEAGRRAGHERGRRRAGERGDRRRVAGALPARRGSRSIPGPSSRRRARWRRSSW